MPDTIKWLLLELGLVAALVPGGFALFQWRRRRAIEAALRTLSQRVKQSEAERKHTLTGILTGAHRLSEARSAEVATTLIRSERTFFRHCFNTLLSQDLHAIEQLAENLYGVLDDYLRKCAAGDAPRAAASEPATRASASTTDDLFAAAEAALDDTTPVAAPALAAAAAAPPAPDEEIDWDAAFAELSEEPAPAPAPAPPQPAQASADLTQDDLDQLLSTIPPAAATESEEEDIMAAWGEALEEQTVTSAEKPGEEDALDLGWDDAFLEETVALKPDKLPGS